MSLWQRKTARTTMVPRLLITAGALAFAILLTLSLWVIATDVRKQVQNLTTAYADGPQWSTAQSDVELLAFLVAAQQLQLAPPELQDQHRAQLRQRHDIFFSRMHIIKTSPLYAQLRSEPDIIALQNRIKAFLQWSSALMDGPDAALDAALPELREKLSGLRGGLRAFTIEAHRRLAAESDRRRENARNILTQVAYLALALIALLASMLLMMTMMIRAGRRAALNQTKSQTRLQSILSTSLDAILVVDAYGRIIDYNGAAEKLFGHPRARALGMSLSQFVLCPAPHSQCAVQLPKPGPGLQRVFGIRADSTRFDAECLVGHLEDTQGAAQVLFLRDITDRLHAEAALVEARDQALAGEKVKADMLAVMSHEMRTPLNGILGTLDLMEALPLDQHARQYLRIIEDSGQLLLGQVNDVLDIARFDAGMMPLQKSIFDLHILLRQVREVIHSAALSNNNRLVMQQDPLLPQLVRGDMKKLRQVLLNLLGNANKFTHNGQVVLGVTREQGGQIAFSISDTGIGIAPEHLEAIFEEFVTIDSSYGRANAGSGLGLAITRRLVTRMGGTMVVDSQLGQGTHFEVALPLPMVMAASDGKTPATPPEPPHPEILPLEVLVIEDNPINRFVVRRMLEHDGHRVSETSNGTEALQIAKDRRFDLVFMDIGLPGMDGTEVARLLRATPGPNQFSHLVALTAHALPADHDRFMAAGIDEALIKPIRQASLRRLIARIPTHAPAAKPAYVNPDQLKDLRASLGEDLYHTLEQRFLEEVSVGLADLGRTQDPKLRADLAHRLAGSAALFGATALHMALITYEAALRESPTPLPHDKELAPLWDRTRQAFRPLIASDDS